MAKSIGISIKIGEDYHKRIKKIASSEKRTIRAEVEIAIDIHLRKMVAQTQAMRGE